MTLLNRTVYVGDLNPLTLDTDLHRLFSTQGTVLSIKMIHNPNLESTGSLCYAYVNYENSDCALKAVQNLNFAELHGTQIRVMLYNKQKNLKGQKIGKYNIIVKNLPVSCDNKTLYDTFSVFGDIISSKVAVDSENKPKGFGFVCYKDKMSVKKAILLAHGTNMNGNMLKVAKFLRKEDRVVEKDKIEELFTNCYIKNFGGLSEEQLKEICANYGEITSFVVPRNADNSLKGFAFCNFKDHVSAKKAIEDLHDLSIEDICEKFDIKISKRLSDAEGEENKNLNSSNKYKLSDDESSSTSENKEESKGKKTNIDDQKEDLKSENESNNEISNNNTGKSNESTNSSDLNAAFENLKITTVENFYIQRAQTRQERHEFLKEFIKKAAEENLSYKRNLYITTLPPTASEKDVLEIFSKHGTITNFKLKSDINTGLKFCYICYKTPEEALIALERGNETILDGHKLNVSFFKTKKERQEDKIAKIEPNKLVQLELEKRSIDKRNFGGELYGMVLSMANLWRDEWRKLGLDNEYAFADRITKLLMERPFNEVRNMMGLGTILSHNINEIMRDISRTSL
ncbi:hypothetical protein EDEG_03560 [Edhazardia aedis USNM 41457]|uniref:RRM domain-containing protein n=1 Tax=Edhazardia aedis (strain USNM 41457) TaxID=1003232 RepID=J8ZQK2_EDHAE|nr:hypothetical protein EDEG_03560 [Edhazardia aedis USNM 41457]|eukprot:EJW01988.1 hypothetical protein EDEG_03560 [Edhazardia aedis USNM 41457]